MAENQAIILTAPRRFSFARLANILLGCWEHRWGWPRRRGRRFVQTCTVCGRERDAKVDFGGSL